MTPITITLFAVALLAIAGIIAIEHHFLSNPLRRHEVTRRTIGVITVLAAALPLVALGLLDWTTWLFILFGFGAAGAADASLFKLEDVRQEGILDAKMAKVVAEHADIIKGMQDAT